MKNISFLILALLQIAVLPLFAQTPTMPDPNLHIYILMGQSNMAGRGVITTEFKAMKNDRVLAWQKDSTWVVATHPLHYDKPKVAGVGPGLSFGFEMAAANPNIKIGLVPCAVGGTSIEKWAPGAYDSASKTHPYDDAVIRITNAMKYGVVKGIIWHQGESNSSANHYDNYLPKLKALMAQIRQLVGSDVPIVIGELGKYNSGYEAFNENLAGVTKIISNSALVTSEGLTDKGDNTHFNSESATEYGKRFARAMLLLQAKKPDSKSKRKKNN